MAGQSAGAGFATLLLQIYLFFVFSRLTEYSGILSKIHLILIVAAVIGLITVLSGGVARAVGTKVGIWLTASTVWMVLAVPFSGWMGGSVAGLVSTWLKSYMTFFFVAGLILTIGQLRKALFALAWGTVGILLVVRFLSVKDAADGRMMVDSGTFGNSNDLATVLLLGLPFCLYVATDKSRSLVMRVFFGLVALPLIGSVLQTGSRAALLTIVLLGTFLFWKASARNKIIIVTAFTAFAAALPFVISHDIKERYMTLLMGDKAETMVADEDDLQKIRSANESTEARRQLLIHAFELTVEHPIFGVGFGQFSDADANKSIAAGEQPLWHEVHNIFAVLMVENGIPAVIFFLGAIFFSFKSVLGIYNRSRRDPEQHEMARLSLALLASLTVFFICNNFSTGAYSMQFPVLGGLAAALGTIVKRDRQRAVAAPPVMPVRRQRPLQAPAKD